jgi:hypothetical protein
MDEYVVPPRLGQQAGIAGALALAERAAAEPQPLNGSRVQLS